MDSKNWTYGIPVPYHVPEWAKQLPLQPASRIQLAQLPTPIHQWNLPGVPDGFELFIKRDDMTGSTITGNKVRKLEFALGEAVAQGCDSIVTIGGTFSNHARSTAVAARELGLEPHLLMVTDNHEKTDAIGARGNTMLVRLTGAKIVLYPFPTSNLLDAVAQMLTEYCSKLRQDGKKPYSCPAGGSNGIGCWGYIDAFREMIEQGVIENFTDIVICVGTGGTASGLGVANYLTGSKLKIHAFTISLTAKEMYNHMDAEIAELGLCNSSGLPIKAKDLVHMNDDYIGAGFLRSTDEELKLIVEVAAKTGIFLDRVFTVKAVRGMLSEMRKDPSQFNGQRVLFIHTGGMLGLLDGAMDDYVEISAPEASKIFSYRDIFPVDIKH